MSPPSGPWSGRRLHFVGVGGAGMSGYARAAHALGAEVTGSDGAAVFIPRPPARGRSAGGADRPRRRERARGRGRGGDLLERGAGGERRAAGRARARPARAPARGAAGGAHRAASARSRWRARTARRPPRRCWCTRCAPPASTGLAGGRSGGGRIAQRGVGRGRVAGGRGGRVRPLDAEPRGGDRGADERRARPPCDLRLACGAGEAFRAFLARAGRGIVVWDRPELLALAEDRTAEIESFLTTRPIRHSRREVPVSSGAGTRSSWGCRARTTR